MATHTYFDFTLRTSFPKKGMHTLQKGNKGVSVSQQQAKIIRDYYMYEGNAACNRIFSSSTTLTYIEKYFSNKGKKVKGMEAIYTFCQEVLNCIENQQITADSVITVIKSVSGIFDPLPVSGFLAGDIAIAIANYVNINSIFKNN